MGGEAVELHHEPRAETLTPKPQRTPTAYQRDLRLARWVIAQLRDQALDSDEPFHVGDLAMDAAALDALWDGLDRVDSHFWHEESMERVRRNAQERPARRWWKFMG